MFLLTPSLEFMLVLLAGWINQYQLKIIQYLLEENRVLKETIGTKRILLTNDQRRRLAAKGKVLGRKMLKELATIVTPDTILAWYRKLIAAKWDYSDRKRTPGRPGVMKRIVEFVLWFAKENPTWGFERIKGQLDDVGHKVAPNTVKNILKANGIDPAPQRG